MILESVHCPPRGVALPPTAMRQIVLPVLVLLSVTPVGCGDTPVEVTADAGAPLEGDTSFQARCLYQNTFAGSSECREYRGAGWDADSVTADCADVFLGQAGELLIGEACEVPDEIGR